MRIAGDEYIGRVFSVLKAISEGEGDLSMGGIAKRLSLPKPTVSRMLKSLGDLGYVQQIPSTRDYRVTNKILELAPPPEDERISNLARPLLAAIHHELDETVNLGRWDGLRLRYVDFLESTRPLRWSPDGRLHEELLCTALGRVLVAFLPREQLDSILPALCQRAGYADVEKMARTLATVRRKGWAVERNQSCKGVTCFAVPLFEGKKAVAAISVSVPNARLEPREEKAMIEKLKSAVH